MGFGIGKINGANFKIGSMSGFSNIIDFGNPASIARAKKMKIETIRSCKPFKPECEFCKEKLGLLNDDVFTKSSKISK